MPGRAPRLFLVEPEATAPLPAPEVDPAAREPETATLADLFQANAAYIFRIGIRLLGRRDQAEDLVQDVFVEAARVAHRLRQPQAARRWLLVVAVRKARRRLRRQRIPRWLDRGETPDYEDLADPAMNPRDTALLAEMYRVLDRLPANHRIAWILRHVEGARLCEVATLCGSSLASVKRHIAAAQRALEEATR